MFCLVISQNVTLYCRIETIFGICVNELLTKQNQNTRSGHINAKSEFRKSLKPEKTNKIQNKQ